MEKLDISTHYLSFPHSHPLRPAPPAVIERGLDLGSRRRVCAISGEKHAQRKLPNHLRKLLCYMLCIF